MIIADKAQGGLQTSCMSMRRRQNLNTCIELASSNENHIQLIFNDSHKIPSDIWLKNWKKIQGFKGKKKIKFNALNHHG